MFVRQFLRHPLQTGAIAASSATLAQSITEGIGIEDAESIIELGPGTGAFTEMIIHRMRFTAKLLLVEKNAEFVTQLIEKFPDPRVQIIRESAVDLPKVQGDSVDAVVSGLPWTLISPEQQWAILALVVDALKAGGTFSTFAYVHAARTPPGKRFFRILESCFTQVKVSPIVWKNFPPAFCYYARL